MTNPTHTPGELKACPYVIAGPWTDDNGATTVEIQIVGGHEVVAEIYADKAETALRMANEAITAWSTRTVDPELLEALNALDRSWLETFPDGPDGDYGIVSIGDEHKALWQQARAAITKATGHG